MIADEDRVVTRLRAETHRLDVRVPDPHVERVLRHVRDRRRTQVRQRNQWLSALAVVLVAMTGAVLVFARPNPDVVTAAGPVLEWPLRGSLKGDRDLLARATDTWRAAEPDLRGREVRPLYAEHYRFSARDLVLVALAARGTDGKLRVAFVTTATSGRNAPDTRALFVRASGVAQADQAAIGFLAARPHPTDVVAEDNTDMTLSFALTGPRDQSLRFRSSVMEDSFAGQNLDGGVWAYLQPGVGAWNTALVTSGGTDLPLSGTDDVDVSPVALSMAGDALKAVGQDVRPGDVITTPSGVVGVVTDQDGSVDTRLGALNPIGTARTFDPKVTGSLTDDGFTPGAGVRQDAISPTNRVLLVDRAHPEVMLVVGTLDGAPGAWRVTRAVNPVSATDALRIGRR